MGKEIEHGKKGDKVYMTIDKAKSQERTDKNFNIADWKPRNNVCVLEMRRIKKESNIILPDSPKESQDQYYTFFLYQPGENVKGLQDKIGCEVGLSDYTPGVTVHPIGGDKEKGIAWSWVYEHAIVMIKDK